MDTIPAKRNILEAKVESAVENESLKNAMMRPIRTPCIPNKATALPSE